MPNQHHPDKEVLGFYLDRRLAQKLRRAARSRSIPITAYLKEVLTNATSNIHLTEEDRREIADRKARKLCGPFTRKHRPKNSQTRPT